MSKIKSSNTPTSSRLKQFTPRESESNRDYEFKNDYKSKENVGSKDKPSPMKPSSSAPMSSANASASTVSSTGKKMTQSSLNNKVADSTVGKHNERLEVSVIPVNEEPYPKQVQIPASLIGSSQHQSTTSQSNYGTAIKGAPATQTNQYPSLKDLFQNAEALWKPIFGGFVSQNKKPSFAIFRRKIERRGSIPGVSDSTDLSLHILYLKRDSTQFPRNAYANQIEVYCSKFFYGPLVVVFGDTNAPYRLHDFPPEYLFDKIDPLNEMEQKCYPLPFGAKKCSLVRALMNEERFTLNLEHLEKVLSHKEFMLYCYKTSFCPINNSQIHDWSMCNYAHRQQDFRRPPYNFFYYPERCPYISDDGSWE